MISIYQTIVTITLSLLAPDYNNIGCHQNDSGVMVCIDPITPNYELKDEKVYADLN